MVDAGSMVAVGAPRAATNVQECLDASVECVEAVSLSQAVAGRRLRLIVTVVRWVELLGWLSVRGSY